MRKSRADTANTTRRIVGSALARFRRRGIERSGVAEIMADVGLSHGGFYRHFESKEALAAEACADGLARIVSDPTMADTIIDETKKTLAK